MAFDWRDANSVKSRPLFTKNDGENGEKNGKDEPVSDVQKNSGKESDQPNELTKKGEIKGIIKEKLGIIGNN